MSLRQILQSPYKSQRTTIHGGCTTRASAAGMTASASRTVARASVTRFIENLPCSHCDRRNEGATDGASIVASANYTSQMHRPMRPLTVLFSNYLRSGHGPSHKRVSRALIKLFLRPKSEGPLESLGVSRPDLWIDDAGRALAVERHDELFGRDAAHIGARLPRHARGVRRRDHVVELQQRMIGRGRLLVPHVNAGACDLFRPQRLGERPLVVDEAARGGDEIGVRLHQLKLACADHSARSLIERTVDRYEVRAPQQLV